MYKSTCRIAIVLFAFGCFVMPGLGSGAAAADSGTRHQVTVPLLLVDGRPHVEVTVAAPDGGRQTARFLVDTGGGAFILPESVANQLGFEWDETFQREGREFARPHELPKAFLDQFKLPLIAERVLIAIEREQAVEDATGLLPGHVLAKHHVIFDYPGRTLTLAEPGTIDPRGEPMPMPVSTPMGFPRTEVEVAGGTYGMLLDTGPPATIISQAVLEDWSEARPDWPRHNQALGETEALARAGGQVLETMVIEDVGWGQHSLNRLTVAAQQEGVFEDYMSRMMTAPVVGALGSNAFKTFRLELDYSNETLYLSQP